MGNYRMYEQALKTLAENEVKPYDTINPFNGTVDSSGICPAITTRPEGFKTAILVVVDGADLAIDVAEIMKGVQHEQIYRRR